MYSYLNQRFKKALYFVPKKEHHLPPLFSLILLIAILIGGGSFFYFYSFNQNYSFSSALAIKSQGASLKVAEESESIILKKPINILLIGIPGEPWPGAYLTDSIDVISLNPEKKKSLVISIPRDLLVKVPETNWECRINALYSIGGPKLLEKVVKEITGLEIDYFLVSDLKTLEKIVDILGGIEVEVKEDIYDLKFPTIDRGYEIFSISAGHQHLDGKIAIKYIRSRHQARGDFGRMERQQQVMEALREKAKELNLFSNFPKILEIYKEIKGEEKTNLGLAEIKALADLSQDLKKENIEYLLIDAGQPDSLLVFGKTIFGRNLASVLWPKAGKFDYSEIRKKISELCP